MVTFFKEPQSLPCLSFSLSLFSLSLLLFPQQQLGYLNGKLAVLYLALLGFALLNLLAPLCLVRFFCALIHFLSRCAVRCPRFNVLLALHNGTAFFLPHFTHCCLLVFLSLSHNIARFRPVPDPTLHLSFSSRVRKKVKVLYVQKSH